MNTRNETVHLVSPAKLNLSLEIVGRKEGFHQLQSLFWPIDFADELQLRPAASVNVDASWHSSAPQRAALPPACENIVQRALSGVESAGGGAWRATLAKVIPMGGGLGGGSSNAGTLLRHFLPRFPQSLGKLAAELGSDVPFFLDPRPTWVRGRGEILSPLTVAPAVVSSLRFLLVCFPKGLATTLVFREYRKRNGAFSEIDGAPPAFSDLGALKSFLATRGNDLEPDAVRLMPEIGEVLTAMRQGPAWHAGLTGSGSTCFAIFDDEEAREIAAKEIDKNFRQYGCKSVKAKTLVQP